MSESNELSPGERAGSYARLAMDAFAEGEAHDSLADSHRTAGNHAEADAERKIAVLAYRRAEVAAAVALPDTLIAIGEARRADAGAIEDAIERFRVCLEERPVSA